MYGRTRGGHPIARHEELKRQRLSRATNVRRVSMMKAAVWYGGNKVEIEDMADPAANRDEVLVRVKSVGICGSDVHSFGGRSKRRVPPLVLGHEFSGVVADVGPSVSDFQNGDKVVVEPIISCGACEPCGRGKTNICTDIGVIGLHSPGAFAEYITVPARKCYKLPAGVSFDEAALVEPLSVATHAINITPTQAGDNLLVIGCGTIGLMVLEIAKHSVAGNVFVSDLIDYRLDVAKRLGANVVINGKREDPISRIKEVTSGKGVDAVVEAVGVEDTVQQALNAVKNGGAVTLTGMLEQMIRIDAIKLVANEITMRGGYCYNGIEFKRSLDLIANGIVDVKPFITHTFSLTDIAKAIAIVTEGKEEHIKIVIRA